MAGALTLPTGWTASRRVERGLGLADRYRDEQARVLLSGVEALVRLALDQRRRDRRAGLRTAMLVTGYPGSPLGGLDRELSRVEDLCAAHDVVHQPALNEELAATAAWGSQLAGQLAGARYEGVLAMWYGKAPGLERAMDALRHGNLVGVSSRGGALAVVGDDPSCKSSTIPSASETLLASLQIPVFAPGSVQDVLDLGLHAFACSRYSGLWCGLKLVAAVADALDTVEVGGHDVCASASEASAGMNRYTHHPSAHLLAPQSLGMERTLLGARTELALTYAREREFNRIHGASDAWLGVVAGGKAHADLCQALNELGLDASALRHIGIRILRLGMIWPLEPEIVRDFARGLDEILVVEEKRAFVEPQVKDVLYGPQAPRVVGKRDECNEALVPGDGDLDADAVARVLAQRLQARGLVTDSLEARLHVIDAGTPARGNIAAGARAHVLLGLSAQHRDKGARRRARGGRDRLPRDGPAASRRQR